VYDFKPAGPSGPAVCGFPAFNRCGLESWLVYLSKFKSPPTFSIKFAREDFRPIGHVPQITLKPHLIVPFTSRILWYQFYYVGAIHESPLQRIL